MKISMFESYYDKNKKDWAPSSWGKCYDLSWTDLISVVNDCMDMKWMEKTKEKNTNAPLISPAAYNTEECHRCNADVTGWDSIFLDIDQDGANQFISVLELLDLNDLNYMLYSSPRCNEDELKFRIVIPVSSFIPKESIDMVWSSVNKFMKTVADEQCKDKSRAYYVPGIYPDGERFLLFEENKKMLDWKWLVNTYYTPPTQPVFTSTNTALNTVQTVNHIIKHLKTMSDGNRDVQHCKIWGIIKNGNINAEIATEIFDLYKQYDPDKIRQQSIMKVLKGKL